MAGIPYQLTYYFPLLLFNPAPRIMTSLHGAKSAGHAAGDP